MTADDLYAEAGRKVLRFHLARMIAREPGTREGSDPEELHSMRVATRRMRAAWRVFGDGFRDERTQKFRRRLRVVASRLGTVRDLDVLIDATEAFAATLPAVERDGLDPLLAGWRDQRESGRRLLIQELDSGGHRRFVEDYRDFVLTQGAAVRAVDPTTPIGSATRRARGSGTPTNGSAPTSPSSSGPTSRPSTSCGSRPSDCATRSSSCARRWGPRRLP